MTNVECPSSVLEGEQTEVVAGGAAGSITILLAEDDPDVRAFVCSLLEQQGYDVLLAENGRQSLELCRRHNGVIHALITDVVMPEINGRELAERAKLLRPELKVVFMSGYVDRGPKDDNASNPSYAFLEKPFSAETLLDTVKSLCGVAARVANV